MANRFVGSYGAKDTTTYRDGIILITWTGYTKMTENLAQQHREYVISHGVYLLFVTRDDEFDIVRFEGMDDDSVRHHTESILMSAGEGTTINIYNINTGDNDRHIVSLTVISDNDDNLRVVELEEE